MKALISKRPASRKWAVGLALASIPLFGFDRGCVTQPQTDILVTTASQNIQGYIGRYDDVTLQWQQNVDGWTRLRVNGGAFSAWDQTDANNVWLHSAVALPLGVNVIDGETWHWTGESVINGVVDDFILERKNDLTSRGTQPDFLDWSEAGIDAHLEEIATATLTGPLTAAQRAAFVADVKTGVRDFFASAYSGTAVTLVNAPGTGVHTVKFHGDDTCGLFGNSPRDYKNANKTQTSNVYVGAFKCTMVPNLIATTPAELTDTLATRVKDVATAIGRTAAHETGHSLGLTEDVAGTLHGCEGMHNCEAYDDANPSDRFNSGHHIMDPGGKSSLHARIGQANPNTRSTKTPKFERYGRSYLEIIHP